MTLARTILASLRDHREEIVALLRDITVAESPTTVPESQRPVQDRLADVLRGAGFHVHRIAGRSCGGHLYARPGNRNGRPYQLLIGHTDTVWPIGTLESMPFEVDGDTARGPGVFDMKGGLVQLVTALDVLYRLDQHPAVMPVVFLNSDEETGSRDSTRWIRRLSRPAKRVFVLEPALGCDGHLKTRRKGTGRFEILVHGRSAHGGLDPQSGASAILELSHLIQTLHAMSDPERGVSVNVGVIDGGTRANVVAPESRAMVDVRIENPDDVERIEAEIHGLEPTTPGTTIEVRGRVHRWPMVPRDRDRALWHAATRAAEELGIEIGEGSAGGASDGNTTSHYTATLDGLGAVGDGAHAAHEHISIDAMIERAALLALLLMSPVDLDASQGLP